MSKREKRALIVLGIILGGIAGYFVPSIFYWAVTLQALDLLQRNESGDFARGVSLFVGIFSAAICGLIASNAKEDR